MSITVLLPSRGRPHRVRAVAESFQETKALEDTKLVWVLSEDDSVQAYFATDFIDEWIVLDKEYNCLTKKLNAAALIEAQYADILGFVADDNIFGTDGWDIRIRDTLQTAGLAYGNDLYQGQGLPTSVFITSDIVRALGWFALPTSDHMYLDNAWKTLGEGLGRLTYLPDVIIEHLHPVVGKGGWDETYSLSNTSERLTKDREAFENWVQKELQYDIQKINEALGVK